MNRRPKFFVGNADNGKDLSIQHEPFTLQNDRVMNSDDQYVKDAPCRIPYEYPRVWVTFPNERNILSRDNLPDQLETQTGVTELVKN